MIIKATSKQQTENKVAGVATRKVLHLINGEHFSGAERVQDLAAQQLPEFGYEVGFACLKPGKFPEVRQSDSPLREFSMRTKLDFGVVGKIVAFANDHDYSILHAHTPRTLMVASLAARRLRCPLVYHVHSPVGKDSERGFANALNGMIERWSLRSVDRMICVSNSLAGYMNDLGHPSQKIRVVQNGVSVVEPFPVPQQPGVDWEIGTMALFRPRKGTEVLLDAIAILKDQGVPIKLRAVGPFESPDYETEIMTRVEKLGIKDLIYWTGFQTNVNEQLQSMDLFVLPSLYGEGLPMVVLEAMANGVPVIASRVEGIPEAVRDGVDGLIFEPGDAKDLADNLASIVGDKQRWESMSSSCIQRQREHLSDRSMAEGIADVYDELDI